MGMFDHVCSEMPLPVGGGRLHLFGRDHQFQTKSFDEEFGGNLAKLIITADGNLYEGYEERNDEGEITSVDYDEGADQTDLTGVLHFYGELVKLEKDTVDNRHERGWGEWAAEVSRGRVLGIKMWDRPEWVVPEGFPPIPREELYARALKLISKGASPPNGVGLHYDEVTQVAEEVLVGKTEALELYEKENWDEKG